MISLPGIIKKQKLTTGYLLIILLFFIFGIVTVRGVFTLGTLTKTIYDHPLVVSNASLHAALGLTKMHRNMKDLVLANAPAEMEAVLNAVDENERNVNQYLDTIRQDILGEEGKALENQTRQLFSSWKPIREEVVRLLKSGDQTKAIHITKAKGADHVAMLELKMLELTAYARKKATFFLNLAEASQSSLEIVTVILTVTGVLLSLVIAFIATYRSRKYESVLLEKNSKLQKALDEIKTLRGIIPICAHCKQIRDDEGMWKRMEEYIHAHSEASFSHGICPDCMQEHYPAEYAAIKSGHKNKK
jgi:hypothetical protein